MLWSSGDCPISRTSGSHGARMLSVSGSMVLDVNVGTAHHRGVAIAPDYTCASAAALIAAAGGARGRALAGQSGGA